MLNAIWLGMILLSVISGLLNDKLDAVVRAITDSAKLGFELGLGLTGIMALWLGILEIAKASGLISILAKLLKPILQKIFPEVPVDHPAMGSIIMNMAANMLGLANAATPFGLQAMKELELLNKHKGVATDAMCTFLAINTSSIQLIPATAIAFLALNNSTNPGSIIFSTLIATVCSTAVAVYAVKYLARLPGYHIKEEMYAKPD